MSASVEVRRDAVPFASRSRNSLMHRSFSSAFDAEQAFPHHDDIANIIDEIIKNAVALTIVRGSQSGQRTGVGTVDRTQVPKPACISLLVMRKDEFVEPEFLNPHSVFLIGRKGNELSNLSYLMLGQDVFGAWYPCVVYPVDAVPAFPYQEGDYEIGCQRAVSCYEAALRGSHQPEQETMRPRLMPQYRR
jgi:hypothetical protein